MRKGSQRIQPPRLWTEQHFRLAIDRSRSGSLSDEATHVLRALGVSAVNNHPFGAGIPARRLSLSNN